MLEITNKKGDIGRLEINGNDKFQFTILGRDRASRTNISEMVKSGYEAGKEDLELVLKATKTMPHVLEIYGKQAGDKRECQPHLIIYDKQIDTERVETEYKRVKSSIEEILDQKGETSTEQKEQLNTIKAEMETLYQKGNKGYLLCGKLVQAYDCIALIEEEKLADLPFEGNLFFDEETVDKLKQKFPFEFKEQYEEIKTIADQYTAWELEDIYERQCSDDLEELSERYDLYSYTAELPFTVPDKTTYAFLEVSLSKEDNEEEGLGRVWIDDIQVRSELQEKIDVPDAGFEDAVTKWEFVGKEETDSAIVDDWAYMGGHSLYLHNNAEKSNGYWKSGIFEIMPGKFALSYHAKIYKTLNKGIRVMVHFLDQDGIEIGKTFPLLFNVKSELHLTYPFEAGYQASAIMYMLTDDKEYALRARNYMMLSLNDNLQGIDAIRVTNARPNGDDKYVAVRQARNANTLATAYSLIRNSGVITEGWEGYKDFRNKINYFLFSLTDIRDRTENVQKDFVNSSSNWQMDMAIGTSMMGMAFYDMVDYPERIIRNGIYTIESQIKYIVNEDGSWPEALRYFASSLERIALFAKALKHVYGIDWFQAENETNIINMFECFWQLQTPKLFYNGCISVPVVGDCSESNAKEFAMFGMYWEEVWENDPQYAWKMYRTWSEMAGKRMPELYIEADGTNMLQVCFMNPIFKGEIKENTEELKNGDFASDYGLYILRDKTVDCSSMLVFVANDKTLGHNHYDQLSFSLYYHNMPFVVDPGVGNYFSITKNNYVSSGVHATVQFSDGEKWINSDTTSYDRVYSNEGWVEILSAKVDAGTDSRQERTIYYLKEHDVFVIYDGIDSEYDTRWNLPVLTIRDPYVRGDEVVMEGFQDIKGQLLFLSDIKEIAIESAVGNGDLPKREGEEEPIINIIHAQKVDDTNCYGAVLNMGGENIDCRLIDDENGIKQYLISIGDKKYRFCMNEEENGGCTLSVF